MLTTLIQLEVFDRQLAQAETRPVSPQIERETTYFRENIAKIETPEELLADFRLYRYVMTAYDLADAVDSRAIIKRVLEEPTSDPASLVNRLRDQKFRELTDGVGYARLGSVAFELEAFRNDVEQRYRRVALETEAGETNGAVRLAAYFERQIEDMTSWFGILSDPPMREVVFTALRVPTEVQSGDLDRLVENLESRYAFEDLKDPAKLDEFIRRFAILSDLDGGFAPSAPNSSALTLLQAIPTRFNLLL